MIVALEHYLIFAAVLFCLGLIGIIVNRKNLITLLLCIELILLAVNTNFIAFAKYFNNIDGQVAVFFILTVAACEAAIGLAILVVLFRKQHSIDVADLTKLRG